MNSLDIVAYEGGEPCEAKPKRPNFHRQWKTCARKPCFVVDGVRLCRHHAGLAVLAAAETELGL